MNRQKISKQLQTFRAWTIAIIAGLFYCYQFIIRVFPNVLNDDLMRVFSIDAAALGVVIGFYSWAYSGMQLPLGLAIDRMGPRILLSLAGFVCGISCLIFASTTSVTLAGAARFLMGIGSACGFMSAIKLGTLWFAPKDLGKVIALTMIFGTIGASLGGSPLSYLVDYIGYKGTLTCLGFIGFGIGVLVFLIVRNSPAEIGGKPKVEIYKNEHPLTDIRRVISTPQAWVIAFYSMLMYAPITIMGDAWGVPFFIRTCEVNEKVAATLVTTMFVGAAVGSPFFTTLSDRLKNRRVPMLVGAVAAFLIYMILLFVPNMHLLFMYGLMFLAGFFYTAKVLSFASICEIMPANMSGVSIAFVNMVVMSTGILFHPLIGHLLEYKGGNLFIEGMPYYSAGDYAFALTVIPLCLFLSIFLSWFAKETHPESSVAKEYGHMLDPDAL